MYSALKVNGKKLYELAREGKVVERKARRVVIYQIRILKMELPRVKMEVSCSKGTYIRTLCHDIGETLGCGGCMESLVRTRVSSFRIADSMTLEEISQKCMKDCLMDVVIPIDAMFQEYQRIVVKRSWDFLAKNGNSLPMNAVYFENEEKSREKVDGDYMRLYDEQGHFVAIYSWNDEKKEYQIIKMFFCEDK